MTAPAYPKIGIERAALTLLDTHVRYRRRDVKPRYQAAANWAAAKAAIEVVHDMGYGSTPAHVESKVTDVYNELIDAGVADHSIPSKGWADLAARLSTIIRRAEPGSLPPF